VKFGLVVPTLNAGNVWKSWLEALNRQSVQPSKCLVIDSSSEDSTVNLALDHGFDVMIIKREDFSHGGTRQVGVERLLNFVDVLVFLTQDAVLADSRSLERLLSAFKDPTVAAAYGRQLPHPTSGVFGAHARLFNYGTKSHIRTLSDRADMGLKACFLSDSFAAYRIKDLEDVGGFPRSAQFGEDMWVAAKLLLANKSICYVAESKVYHSHDYGIKDEFDRYREVGRFHAENPWLLESFGSANGEGKRFVFSELKYLFQRAPHLLPWAFIRTLSKYLGYNVGLRA